MGGARPQKKETFPAANNSPIPPRQSGEFGDVCLGSLRAPSSSSSAGAELQAAAASKRVAVKVLRANSPDRVKLDFLVEAVLLGQFEHSNIIHVDGLVARSEPAMLVAELMENGPLDVYLRVSRVAPQPTFALQHDTTKAAC